MGQGTKNVALNPTSLITIPNRGGLKKEQLDEKHVVSSVGPKRLFLGINQSFHR